MNGMPLLLAEGTSYANLIMQENRDAEGVMFQIVPIVLRIKINNVCVNSKNEINVIMTIQNNLYRVISKNLLQKVMSPKELRVKTP